MKNRFKNILILLLWLLIIWACKKEESIELVRIADDELLSALLEQGIDTNQDGLISIEEAEGVIKVSLVATKVNDFSGLESFSNLDSLILKMVPVESINLSGISGLRYFNCTMCSFTNVDLTGNLNLEELICENNQIESLKLPSGQNLKTIRCGYNRLRELDISTTPDLVSLHCNNNLLTHLDLSNNLQLTKMISCGNQLTSLDVSKNKSITLLGVDNMPMLSLVYVWTLPFPPEGVNVLMTYSPRLNFMLK